MLVGRAREVSALHRALDGALGGRGSIRAIHGEAGIGKTRLADEIDARARESGFVTAWGRASETGGAPAFWPWIQVLGVLARKTIALPEDVRAIVEGTHASVADGAHADPVRARFTRFEAVRAFLEDASHDKPLFLVFDDMHAADAASLELLAFVARAIRSMPVMVVVTYRTAEAKLPHVADAIARIAREGEATALANLSREEVGTMAETNDAEVIRMLHELTEGNPLLVRETLHAIAMRSDVTAMQALRSITVTGTVLSLVQRRLEGASKEVSSFLSLLSTIGREIDLRLATSLEPRATDLVEEGARLGFLVRRDEGTWAFSHVLVREAFYQSIPAHERRKLHASIARALGDDQLSARAVHALAALPDGDATEAVKTARLAAERARSQLAYEEAIALLEKAASVKIEIDPHERAEVLLSLGWASTEAGQLERGRDCFREVADLARRSNDHELLARAALGQGGQYVIAEIRPELVSILREALSKVRDRNLRARVLARLAAALTPASDPSEPLALARQAIEEADGAHDLRTRIDVDVGAGSAFIDFAPAEERIPVSTRLVAAARSYGDRVLELRGLTRLACDLMEKGDFSTADSIIEQRAQLADAIGHPRYTWQTPLLRSMRAMTYGYFDECEEYIEHARALGAEASDPNMERSIAVHRFFMLLLAGRRAYVEQQADAIRVMNPLPDGPMYAPWFRAIVYARTGERDRGIAELRAMQSPTIITARMARITTGETVARLGAREECEVMLRSLAKDGDTNAAFGPFAFACSAPIPRVRGALLFALGRKEDALKECQRALELSTKSGAPSHLAWVHLTLGEGLGKKDGAVHLDAALEIATRAKMDDVIAYAHAITGADHKPAPATIPSFSLRRSADVWIVEHRGRSFELPDVRGMKMLETLVSQPNQEIHALDLASQGQRTVDLGDAGEVLDKRARDAYAKRLSELREDHEEASANNDTGRATKLSIEIEALEDQLAGAIGLGGRERRSGSAAERARVTVQRRVREAIKKIAREDAELGRHLEWTIRTGAFCAYEPHGRS